jgi:hypothetical protein
MYSDGMNLGGEIATLEAARLPRCCPLRHAANYYYVLQSSHRAQILLGSPKGNVLTIRFVPWAVCWEPPCAWRVAAVVKVESQMLEIDGLGLSRATRQCGDEKWRVDSTPFTASVR